MHTQVCVVGTVATDPKLTKSSEKAAFCSFRLACNERRFDAVKQEWIDSETHWFTVNSFRGLADHAVTSFHKGDRVIVNGRLRVRDWTNNERSGTSAIVDADALGHDLRWGTSVFTKLSVPAAPDDTEVQPGPEGSVGSVGPLGTVASTAPAEGALVTAGFAETGAYGAPADGAELTNGEAEGSADGNSDGDSNGDADADADSTTGEFDADGFTPISAYSAA